MSQTPASPLVRLAAAVALAAASALLMAGAGDVDGDGIPDKEDDCPKVFGPKPTGCPKPDRDKDGLWDGVDSCPLEPEDPNGLQDGDGCPDDPDLVETPGAVFLRAPFVFPKGRTAPPADMQNAAKAVARWAKRDSRVQRVEVIVIADPAEGKKGKAELVAQDRADALSVTLGAAGVRQELLTTRIQTPAKKGDGLKARQVQIQLHLGTGPRPSAEGTQAGASSASEAAVSTATSGAAPAAAATGSRSAPAPTRVLAISTTDANKLVACRIDAIQGCLGRSDAVVCVRNRNNVSGRS